MDEKMTAAVYSILIAFVFNVILCPVVIPLLRRLKFGQNVRDDGPETHLVKAGTPTMGGIMILLSMLLSSLFFIKGNSDGIIVLFMTLGYGIIGFIDDYIKVVKKRSLGLRAWQKIVLQLVVTGIFIYYIYNYTDIGTAVYVPFMKGFEIDLGILFIPFVIFAVLGTVNAVNLTDGLDGLASGVTVLVTLFFMFAALKLSSGVLPIAGAAAGSLLGFLLFNSYPAKVFMGDTGSLALGGFLAAVAVLFKMPLFLIVVGIIYVLEALSVILQVGYFKLTHGKRIFKMAPLHHHFEKCGWNETKVVAVFYIITSIAVLVGFLAADGIF
ncbi:MAG: phospho-N-acetylmuramoyl-pentapeptide-transferase [Clostridiales bacterium]|nr:phospho-N-acetylmuramoyl-pentapeptide-transferase [Clostridiales bacterium]